MCFGYRHLAAADHSRLFSLRCGLRMTTPAMMRNLEAFEKVPRSSEIVLVLRRFFVQIAAQNLVVAIWVINPEKVSKMTRQSANALSASRSFSLAGSSDCEESRGR